MSKLIRTSIVILAGVLAAACGRNDSKAPVPTASGTSNPPPAKTAPLPSAQPGPSDGEIAQIVTSANSSEIAAAQLALTKSQNNDVKDFANMMVKDHGDVNQQVADLGKKNGIAPMPNATADKISNDGQASIANLQQLDGLAFDRAYIHGQIVAHQNVLKALDTTLIPSAKNADLKNLLTNVRGAVQTHLDHAQKVSGMLGT